MTDFWLFYHCLTDLRADGHSGVRGGARDVEPDWAVAVPVRRQGRGLRGAAQEVGQERQVRRGSQDGHCQVSKITH